MDNKEINKFHDYSKSLQLFEECYLYEGYEKDIKAYATSYVGRGENDVVRNDSYSKCVECDEKGVTTWKITSPRNIFGLQIESSVNHNEHNKVTTKLILNSGKFDLNRIMNRFAEIDITDFNKEQIMDLAKKIMGKNNEDIIFDYGIKEDVKGILENSIIMDSILEELEKEDPTDYPEIKCDGKNGNINLKTTKKNIEIQSKKVKINDEEIVFEKNGKFPKCKYEIEGIKGDDKLLSKISDKVNFLSNFGKRMELIEELLVVGKKEEELVEKIYEAINLKQDYEKAVNKQERSSQINVKGNSILKDDDGRDYFDD